MKRLSLFLVITAFAVCCFSCQKDPVQMDQIMVEQTDIQFVKETDSVFAELTGSCLYSEAFEDLTIRIGLKDDFSDAVTRMVTIKDDSFYTTTMKLLFDTIYYIQYVSDHYSEEFEEIIEWKDDTIYTFSTRNLHFPVVSTKEVSFVSTTHAMGIGEVEDEEGEVITERGFCWGTHSKPQILTDNSDSVFFGDTEMFVEMAGLASGTVYFARAYAKNRCGITYSNNEVRFQTKSSNLVVETLDPTDITGSSARLNGKVIVNNSFAVFCSFMFGSTPNTDNEIFIGSFFGGETSSSISKLFGYNVPNDDVPILESGWSYYVRAFIIDKINNDTIFGQMKPFTTNRIPYNTFDELEGFVSVGQAQQISILH